VVWRGNQVGVGVGVASVSNVILGKVKKLGRNCWSWLLCVLPVLRLLCLLVLVPWWTGLDGRRGDLCIAA
jgi:hypothetical protein